MGKKTCILCCTSDPAISYFNFPTDHDRRNEWLQLCQITWEIPKTARLCAKHFSAESYSKTPNESNHRRRLKFNAVPSQYLDSVINDDENQNNVESSEFLAQSVVPYKWCFICGSVNDSERTFHRFPKNVDNQNVWLSKCGPFQSSCKDMNDLRLCNIHFSPDSFIHNPRSKKRYLKPGSVPIVGSENESVSRRNLNNGNEVANTKGTKTSVSAHTDASSDHTATLMEIVVDVDPVPLIWNSSLEENYSISSTRDDCSIPLDNIQRPSQCTSENVLIRTSDKACQTENGLLQAVTYVECSEPRAQPSMVVAPTTLKSKVLLRDHCYLAAGPSKPVRSPRYVRDIATPHLATPNRAKRCLNMTKQIIESKNKTIASLGRKLRHAQEKVKTLKDLIIHLRNAEYISETL